MTSRCLSAFARAALLACLIVVPRGFAHAQAAGVVVDTDGVLRTQVYTDQTGQLMNQRIAAAKAQLAPTIAKPTAMRKISLNRLDASLKEKLQNGELPSDEMKNLAGLTRIEYVFYYPASKDIVIAGPAEGWTPDLSGRVCGINSGKPVVQLDDLVTALALSRPMARTTRR